MSQHAGNSVEKPDVVRDVVLMLYAASGIGLLYVVLRMDELMTLVMQGNSAVLVMLLFSVFSAGLTGVTAFFLSRGKNWARMMVMVLVVLSVFVSALELYDVLTESPGFFINCLIVLLLDSVALFCLLRPRVAAWFVPEAGRKD